MRSERRYIESVSELEKYINNGWYEIRTRLDKPDDLFDYLQIEKNDLRQMAEGLRLSVEKGVVEYKRSLLHSIMSHLGTLKYNSRAITDLGTTTDKSSYLTSLPVLQRLIALGLLHVPQTDQKESEEAMEAAENKAKERPNIKTIVSEVHNMINERPEIQKNNEVKRIFLQLKNYNNELAKKKSLEPNIPKEKKASFEENFRQVFEDIHQKIYNAYSTLLSREEEQSQSQSKLPLIKRYDFSRCDDVFRSQAEEASRLYHTLAFAIKERSQMREILLEIAAAEPYYEKGYTHELACYKKIVPFSGDDIQVSLAYAETLRRYCERSIEWRPK